MSTGPQTVVPTSVTRSPPIASPPGDVTHLTETVEHIEREIQKLSAVLPMAEKSGELETLSKKLERRQKIVQPLMWVVVAIGSVFSAGMGYAMFLGENATDTEVETVVATSVTDAMTDHNGASLDEGSHPQLTEAIRQNGKKIVELEKQTKVVRGAQKKLDKRSRYQFEFSRWQASVMEAERRRKKRPSKPPVLTELETDLMMGKYD